MPEYFTCYVFIYLKIIINAILISMAILTLRAPLHAINSTWLEAKYEILNEYVYYLKITI